MKKILTVCTVLLLLLTATSSQARNGIYFTAEAGYADQTNLPPRQDAAIEPLWIKETSNFPPGYRFSVGYNHDLARWFGFGLNIGAGRYGRDTYYFPAGPTTMYTRTLEFLGVGTFHIKQTDLFFRAGGIRETPVIKGSYGQENHTDSRPEYGVGAAYNLTNHVALMLSYSRVMGLGGKWRYLIQPKNPDLNEVLLGVRFTC